MTERPTPVTPPAPPAEWWRFRMVWLVLAGPAAVVVASLVTAVVAWRHIDPVIGDEPEIARRPMAGAPTAQTPAMLARNHAATPPATPALPARP